MSLYRYFKPDIYPAVKSCENNTDFKSVSVLPSPSGPMSLQMPSFHIDAANNLVQDEVQDKMSLRSKRGPYKFHSSKNKARIANYAVLHGTPAALKQFKKEFPSIK
uniref:Uncharacterized protein n=1 Tax=Amphimedon queenslandica TaxID=400682 RepID=A0A1X7UCY9_AMPQE